jgi:hypothetical protein
LTTGSPVPEAWTRLIGLHRAAQVAQDQMKDPAATQIARDEAIIRYSRATDAMVAEMTRLSEAQDLGRITLFLSKRERR